jgi:transcriptional regulator with XRE-family HTH domain
MMEIRPSLPATFAERLGEAVRRSGFSKSEFAQRADVDRTTLSQLLAGGDRLPRLDTVFALAAEHELSVDWLVGLSNTGPVEAEMVVQHTSFETPGPTPTDERLLAWLTEAADYKIRYIPATLPDLLKTDEVIRFERSRSDPGTAQTVIATTAARLAWARHPDTDMECCSSTQAITSFARGEGIWSRLNTAARRDQLDHMIELVGELYPTFRWFLFDGSKRYAAPVTVFGAQRAALYLGQLYLVLTSTEHVRTLSRHFDGLIRDAEHQASGIRALLIRLLERLDR